jgi:hypothetical protein
LYITCSRSVVDPVQINSGSVVDQISIISWSDLLNLLECSRGVLDEF